MLDLQLLDVVLQNCWVVLCIVLGAIAIAK
jgi:hypothetical protein